MFHLARIQAISLTDRDFQVPAGFDLTSLANRGWARSFTESLKEDHQPIRIKARKEVSERLRRDWFFRYAEREEAADGKVILTYYDHLPSAPYLPCRFGADCEVLEPQELREQMIAHARKVLALYGA
jgi:predicted DNA-binding transcriptional regulator YafY